jgi:periplasmic protein CpxP/Spy
MKKPFLYSAAIVALLLGTVAAYAQEPAPQGGGQWGGRGQMPTVDQRLQRMTQALNLSEDQQQKIKPILENESTQMQTLRADTSLSQEDRMAKMKEIRANTTSQINPILNPDQQKQYAEMNSRMGHGRGGPGGPSQTPPPPQPQQ